MHGAKALGVKALDAGWWPFLGQGLARQTHVHRAARLAVHHAVGAAQRLFHHHAAGQAVLPLDVGPHQAGHVKRVLHKMHVVVARAGQFPAQGVRRFARHQQHRLAAAKHVVQAHRRIGRARVHMHQHRLAAPGDGRVASGHVDGHVLVRTQRHARMRPALRLPLGHRLNDGCVVGAEIAKKVLDAQLDQALQQVVGGTVGGAVAGAYCGVF